MRVRGAIALAVGAVALFTSEPSTRLAAIDGCAVIGRFTVRRWTTAAQTRALVDTWPAARATQWMSWTAKKVVKAAAGGAYLRARERIFGE